MVDGHDRRAFLLGAAGAALLPMVARATAQDLDVPYVPTPPEVVAGMLDLAELKAGERLVDLGSGDGRIPIAAARRGATALGVEIDHRLVTRARSLAQIADQSARARFLRADLFTVSLRDADVVTLYLLPDVNEKLKPKLLNELRPGARVVSHAFDMGDWPPDVARSIAERQVYLWTIPATAGGDWRLTRADGTVSRLTIEQRYSAITGTLDDRPFRDARLHGVEIGFTIDGTRYDGVLEYHLIRSNSAVQWHADRL
ncbi:class I SAM-dependent methyltransferase [Sphingomonas sp. HF-S3]|uniref:Class I SAM-dependent methyltransferase n=1 Tax=Sphingomonas rustica TaxID=3103142 RepID=A0ABV0BDY0_9SPHN